MSAFNGSGTFVISGVGLPYVAGTTISSTVANQLNTDLGTGLSTCITKDGQTTPTGNIPMGGFKITGLGVAAGSGDAVSYAGAGNFAGMVGTATNDNAAVGRVGEYTEALVASGAPVSISQGVAINVTSISLTAGDWDVNGIVYYNGNAATTVQYILAGISATTNTMPNNVDVSRNTLFLNNATVYVTVDQCLQLGPARFSLAVTTTIYLVAQSGFGVSTSNAYGQIRARRVR